MNNFSKRNEPKIVTNLSSNHVNSKKFNNNDFSTKVNNKVKRDSSSFHETKIKYQNNLNNVPDYQKTSNKKFIMPDIEYTEEEKLLRPIEEKNKVINLETKEKENLKFTKSIVEPMINPVNELFQNTPNSVDKIEIKENVDIKSRKEKKKNKYTKYILLAIFLEIIILGIIYFIRELNSKEILECTSSNYSSYYEANIRNTKKYYFKHGKITKLEDTTEYKFDNKGVYDNFKEVYATPPYTVLDGRIIVSNINDNDYIYLEKATYDYKKLRDKNKSSDKHNIFIPNDNNYDEINLIDYNINNIKIIYSEDYTCR